jgi:Holliday junction resolvase RusA-like endonuclease
MTSAIRETAPLPLRFFVPGEPKAKERPRTVRLKKSGRIVTFTPRTTLEYEDLVRRHAQRAAALTPWARPTPEQRFYLAVEFHLATARRRDVDNMLKAVQDGLQGALWADDWQISQVLIRRILKSPKPGVYITVAHTAEVFSS